MQIEKSIILTEFPKSGGSWITSMLGDALQIPQRDLYVRPGFDLFDIKKHPWYSDANNLDFPERSVVKSHELPGSKLIDFDATYIHLVRDGRDVVVSKWFFDKEFCIQNGISTSFEEDFGEYVEKTARDWANYVLAWTEKPVVTIRYEEFLSNPVHYLGSLLIAIGYVNFSRKELEDTVSKFTKEKFKASLGEVFKHNTFVRKGISGDWRNHFSEENVVTFKRVAGDALLSLGYEVNSDWNI